MMKASAEAVLDLLRERGSVGITDQDAIRELHQTRLASRIHDLKGAGFAIEDRWERRGAVRWKRYWLRPRLEPMTGTQTEAFA